MVIRGIAVSGIISNISDIISNMADADADAYGADDDVDADTKKLEHPTSVCFSKIHDYPIISRSIESAAAGTGMRHQHTQPKKD